MSRWIGAVAIASVFAGLSNAQTLMAPEGNWDWNAELDVNGLKLGHSGSTCLSPDGSELDLSDLFKDINETCSISGVAEQDDATVFALTCIGEHSANMSGEIFLGQEDASLTLAGAVSLGGSGPVTLVFNGKAVRTSACVIPDAEIVEDAALAEAEQARIVLAVEAATAENANAAAASAETATATTEPNAEAQPQTETDAEDPAMLAGGAEEVAPAVSAEVSAPQETAVLALPTPALIAEAPIMEPIPVAETR